MSDSEFITFRNEHGYWVAKVFRGDYKTAQSWAIKRKVAVRTLREVIEKLDKGRDTSK